SRGPQQNRPRAGVTDFKTIAASPICGACGWRRTPPSAISRLNIAGLKNLTYLNLTNTDVTDAGQDQVSTSSCPAPLSGELLDPGFRFVPRRRNPLRPADGIAPASRVRANNRRGRGRAPRS